MFIIILKCKLPLNCEKVVVETQQVCCLWGGFFWDFRCWSDTVLLEGAAENQSGSIPLLSLGIQFGLLSSRLGAGNVMNCLDSRFNPLSSLNMQPKVLQLAVRRLC